MTWKSLHAQKPKSFWAHILLLSPLISLLHQIEHFANLREKNPSPTFRFGTFSALYIILSSPKEFSVSLHSCCSYYLHKEKSPNYPI